MGEVFLTVATEDIVKKVLSLAAEGASLALGFKAELQRLGKRFETAQQLLNDARNLNGLRISTVQNWLKKLEVVTCKADDMLDEYAYEVYRRKFEVQNRMRNKVRNFFSLSNPRVFRLKMAFEVKNVHLSLDELYKEANELGLRPVELTISSGVEPRIVGNGQPYVDDSKIVGRDNDVSKVVSMLLGSSNIDKNYLPVTAIKGMGGLGKTALAQMVFKDEEVNRNFGEHKMWVCVSDDFKVEIILNQMQESLTGTKLEVSNIQGMVKKLEEKLGGKRYLLVLDDVWNNDPEKWESLMTALLAISGDRGSRGSRILVTTRTDEAVFAMRKTTIYHIGELSFDDSWIMFKKRAFSNGGPRETPNLERIGKRIVEKCGGVPLAVKTLGGLMCSKMHEHEWSSIQESEIWNSPEMNNNNNVLRVLMLSFDNLQSTSLKRCFAYCSRFPKDFRIDKNDLVQRWMAQGYLQPSRGSNHLTEDVGDNYFKILLWNSLLQDVQKDEYNNITWCKMHDLVHDLALEVSRNYCFTSKASELTDVLHLPMIYEEKEVKKIPKECGQRLRTLHLSDNLLESTLQNFKGLREFELTDNATENLPESIGKLKHLRYLKLSSSIIESLPGSLCKLYNLQTLNTKACVRLTEFPTEFRKLVSLRHLHMNRPILMPTGIGQLTSLQTLPFFGVGQDNGRRIEELRGLSNLGGKLEIYDLQNVRNREEAQKANLSSKPLIQELRFVWEREIEREVYNDEDVLEGLQPHSNLKGLTIVDFGGKNFPSWMRIASHMPVPYCFVKIKLKNCNKCKQMPALGHLPCLTNIEIHGMDNLECIGVEFYGRISHEATVFPKLKVLSLRNMSNLAKWLEADVSAVAAVFPCLEELNIEHCDKLVTAPGHFPAIKKLRVHHLNDSQALVKMSRTMTTLENLQLESVSGIDLVLVRLLVNNKFLRELRIELFEELSDLPSVLENLASLKSFGLMNCPNLMCLPNGLHLPASLESLEIELCPKLVVANPDPHEPMSLEDLTLLGLETQTIDWARLLLSLTGLRTLEIGYFSEELDYFPWPNATATEKEEEDNNAITQQRCLQYPFIHLESLRLWGWENVKSLPQQLQHLTALKDLSLRYFNGLESLPEWLGKLSSLQSLYIYKAKKLVSLPTGKAMQCLVNLLTLTIYDCPLLKERCNKGTGPEWHKISHIPSIVFDDHLIQLLYNHCQIGYGGNKAEFRSAGYGGNRAKFRSRMPRMHLIDIIDVRKSIVNDLSPSMEQCHGKTPLPSQRHNEQIMLVRDCVLLWIRRQRLKAIHWMKAKYLEEKQ